MKKKIYNQPEIFVSSMMPNSIICASITDGGGTDGKGEVIGD